MDREYVGTLLLLATAAPALWVWNSPSRTLALDRSARTWEAHCWRALWASTWPLAVAVAIVAGWWLTVPDACPLPPRSIIAGSALFAGICARAVWRAWRSARDAQCVRTLATVGLWSPRVRVPSDLARRLDPAVFDAALAHEAAHLRHRDPVRIWLAQIVTDLQWPWPWARRRFAGWRAALEMARDEEARAAGTAGVDLAAAIVALARLQATNAVAAALASDGRVTQLRDRVDRLLAPMPKYDTPRAARGRCAAAVALTVVCIGLGLAFGQTLVWTAFRLLP